MHFNLFKRKRHRSRKELLDLYKDCPYFNERKYNEALSGDNVAFCNIGMDFTLSNEFDYAVDSWKNIEHVGIAEVYNNLGVSYFYGNGVELNYEKALFYYKKSEELGNDFGIYNVGVCYERGIGGVDKNLTIALEKYRFSAKMGNSMAKEQLFRLTGEIVDNGSNYTDCNPGGIQGYNSCNIETGTNYAYELNNRNANFDEIYIM